jgi:hypothetical protein
MGGMGADFCTNIFHKMYGAPYIFRKMLVQKSTRKLFFCFSSEKYFLKKNKRKIKEKFAC